ncbi:hypothetical protein Scep_001883 [Stephania cephalantha]|uniref:Uncharacterized protein n=1 Tax=Stephania cephalantha TaxID=152367 RepID=A0AAP0L8V3_9MAGN
MSQHFIWIEFPSSTHLKHPRTSATAAQSSLHPFFSTNTSTKSFLFTPTPSKFHIERASFAVLSSLIDDIVTSIERALGGGYCPGADAKAKTQPKLLLLLLHLHLVTLHRFFSLGCCWWWLAKHSSLCKYSLLLYHRHSTWSTARLSLTFLSQSKSFELSLLFKH